MKISKNDLKLLVIHLSLVCKLLEIILNREESDFKFSVLIFGPTVPKVVLKNVVFVVVEDVVKIVVVLSVFVFSLELIVEVV
jgi:hypothetical protein